MRVRLIHGYLSALSPLPPPSSSRLACSFLSLSVGPLVVLPAACPGFALADLLGHVSPSSGYIRVSLRLGCVGLPTIVCTMEVQVLRQLGRRTMSSAILGLLADRRRVRRALTRGVEEVGRETSIFSQREGDITSTLELTGEEGHAPGNGATATSFDMTEEGEEKKEKGAQLDWRVITPPDAALQVPATPHTHSTWSLMPPTPYLLPQYLMP